jgi:hypothetical protein
MILGLERISNYLKEKEWNDPRFRENFELLERKGSKWLENHPPKIKEE